MPEESETNEAEEGDDDQHTVTKKVKKVRRKGKKANAHQNGSNEAEIESSAGLQIVKDSEEVPATEKTNGFKNGENEAHVAIPSTPNSHCSALMNANETEHDRQLKLEQRAESCASTVAGSVDESANVGSAKKRLLGFFAEPMSAVGSMAKDVVETAETALLPVKQVSERQIR
jgi:hypothetical protein